MKLHTEDAFDVAALAQVSPPDRTIGAVRLVTRYWHDGAGMYSRKSVLFRKRGDMTCGGLLKDCSYTSAYDVLRRIVNLDKCRDGLYWITLCDLSHDEETGTLDDYNYKLVPRAEHPRDAEKEAAK